MAVDNQNSISGDTEFPQFTRPFVIGLILILFLAVICRVIFVTWTDLPRADPWRHIQLVDNIRSGAGFTLYENQPYIWYSPVWHYLAATVAPSNFLQWIAAVFSLLACLFFTLFLYWRGADTGGAFAGGFLMACFGPAVAFSCQFGSEGFALALLTGSLLLTLRGRGAITAIVSGILFGLCLSTRLHFVFTSFLFFPLFRKLHRGIAFCTAATVPVFLHWWRNHEVISNSSFVFTWDGLATRGDSYNLLSKLVPQLNAVVVDAASSLFIEIFHSGPQWLYDGRYRWEIVIFGLVSILCLIGSRKISVILSGFSAIIYFIFIDDARSSHFFRIWFIVFPPIFIAVADVTSLYLKAQPHRRWLAVVAVLLIGLTGILDLRPRGPVSTKAVTLPPDALTETHYLVNSGFYHPQAFMRRYPDKHFIGMPLHPEDFEDFNTAFPQYRTQLWHRRFNVQNELLAHLLASERYSETSLINEIGFPYLVLKEKLTEVD
jgi:hypothetical protein